MAAHAARVTIGAVLDRLRPEFPAITVSKIRFLEEQGLVVPERTASGYRKFSEEDVERIRYVLRAQRDRFLPLKVVRAELDAGALHDTARPTTSEADDNTHAGGAGAGDDGGAETLEPVDTEELCRRAGIDRGLFRDLVTFGFLARDDTGRFGPEDVAVAAAAGALVARGVEVRHLRPFRTAAEREVELVEHVVGLARMRGRGDDEAGRAGDVTAQALAEAAALHEALVVRGARAGGLR